MSNTNNSRGVSSIGLLQIMFIGLKLMGYIKWSWVWVLSPIWITFLVVTIAFFIIEIIKDKK